MSRFSGAEHLRHSKKSRSLPLLWIVMRAENGNNLTTWEYRPIMSMRSFSDWDQRGQWMSAVVDSRSWSRKRFFQMKRWLSYRQATWDQTDWLRPRYFAKSLNGSVDNIIRDYWFSFFLPSRIANLSASCVDQFAHGQTHLRLFPRQDQVELY